MRAQCICTSRKTVELEHLCHILVCIIGMIRNYVLLATRIEEGPDILSGKTCFCHTV
jgi:hypothetical protein